MAAAWRARLPRRVRAAVGAPVFRSVRPTNYFRWRRNQKREALFMTLDTQPSRGEPADSTGGGSYILRAANLTREVEGKRIVDDVSFTIGSGDIAAIIGPSGSGKSSLLRLLNRLDEPTHGTVFLEGTDYREIAPRALRRRVGMLLQQPYLFPGSVAANLAYGPEAQGRTLSPNRAVELLERVGLAGYGERDVARLSGGEAQRISLARTLANEPEILLLDEPTSALDEAARLGVEELICNIIERRNLTCIIVTHDHAQAARMARHSLRLEEGRI
ncbi:MAG: ATP-binding cassette domain-containing protein, partial [Gemmatimonadales bacterium]